MFASCISRLYFLDVSHQLPLKPYFSNTFFLFFFDFCLFCLFTLGARLCRFNKVHLLIDARYTSFRFFPFIPTQGTMCLLFMLGAQLHMKNSASACIDAFSFPIENVKFIFNCAIWFKNKIYLVILYVTLRRLCFHLCWCLFDRRARGGRERELHKWKICRFCGWIFVLLFACCVFWLLTMPLFPAFVPTAEAISTEVRVNRNPTKKRKSWLFNCIWSHNQSMAHSSIYASDASDRHMLVRIYKRT